MSLAQNTNYIMETSICGFKKGGKRMEVKKGDNITKIPGWVIAAGIATVGAIVADICRTIEKKSK